MLLALQRFTYYMEQVEMKNIARQDINLGIEVRIAESFTSSTSWTFVEPAALVSVDKKEI